MKMEIPKASKIIFTLMFLTPVFGGIYFVKNQMEWPVSAFEINTYLEQRRDAPIYDWDQARNSVKEKKDTEKKTIILWTISIFIVLLITGYAVKKVELKNNLKEILKRLKAKGVIKEEEYQQKLNSINEAEESKSLSKAIRSERKDLQKLKSKGLISKTNYEKKLNDLSDKFSGSKEGSFENQKISSIKSDNEKLFLFLLPLPYILFNFFLLFHESREDYSDFEPRQDFLFPWDFADAINYGYNEYDLSEFVVYVIIPIFLFWGLKYLFCDKKPLEGTIFD